MLRVDEFKKQLETMHENIASSSDKMQDLHERMRMLKDLFKRIDQVEVRLYRPGYIRACWLLPNNQSYIGKLPATGGLWVDHRVG